MSKIDNFDHCGDSFTSENVSSDKEKDVEDTNSTVVPEELFESLGERDKNELPPIVTMAEKQPSKLSLDNILVQFSPKVAEKQLKTRKSL